MKKILLLLIFFVSTYCFSQKEIAIGHADSIELFKAWEEFSEGLTSDNQDLVKPLSLKNVYCLACCEAPCYNFFVDIDTFLLYFGEYFQKPRIRSMIQSDKKEVFAEIYLDYRPSNFDFNEQKDCVIYNIGFKFTELIQISSDKKIETPIMQIFQFVKINNRFVFYGFDILP